MARRSVPRPCLDCGRLTINPSRCDTHQRAHRPPVHPAYRDPEYKRIRAEMIADHVRRFGWTCPGAPDLEHESHPCTDLTADHIISLSEGGAWADRSNLRVLCRRANTAKGGANRRPTP